MKAKTAVRQGVMLAVAAGAASVMSWGQMGAAAAAPDGPVAGTSGKAYKIDVGDVCREQYQRSDAWADNPVGKFDPYSLQCKGLEVSFPPSVSWPHLGNLDIQGYCNKFYSGSVAKPIGQSVAPQENWYCVYA